MITIRLPQKRCLVPPVSVIIQHFGLKVTDVTDELVRKWRTARFSNTDVRLDDEDAPIGAKGYCLPRGILLSDVTA